MRASRSRSSSFGVVPEAMSAWKPLIDPHAIVMKANGKRAPAKIGPVVYSNTSPSYARLKPVTASASSDSGGSSGGIIAAIVAVVLVAVGAFVLLRRRRTAYERE